MALPSKPKKDPRPTPVTVRLSELAVEYLKILAEDHNLSQADVVEHLIRQEYELYKDGLLNRKTKKK